MINLRIIDKVTLENLRNPTYAVITALNSPRSAPIEGIQPSVEQQIKEDSIKKSIYKEHKKHVNKT